MTSETKQQSLNFNIIIKIIYKNLILISLTTILITALATFFAFNNRSYKSEITLYGNDRVLTEIGENSQYSLNSFDFLSFIQENSKILNNKNLSKEKFLNEMTNRLSAQSETGNPTIKVKFSTKNKTEGEKFSEEYTDLAQKYLEKKENAFLDVQIKLLEEQYQFLSMNNDLRTTKDSLTDTLVSRLAYYRLIKNDTTPLVRLISVSTKPSLNKKFVLVGGFIFGVFLGIFISFVKEFSKTLDWKNIKS